MESREILSSKGKKGAHPFDHRTNFETQWYNGKKEGTAI